MKKYNFKSTVRTEAMRLFNSLKNEMSNSDAMRQAWKVAKAKAAMQNGEAIITFFKKGEEVPTVRFGTLSSQFISYTSKNTGRKKNATQVAFFDLDSQSFKSFIASNLVQCKAVA